MRKLSVLAVSIIAGSSSLGMLAAAPAGAAATGAVTCSVAGEILVTGHQISNVHPSGEREGILRDSTASCHGTDIAGARNDWSIDVGDLVAHIPLASTTCNGLTALRLGHGAVITHVRLRHNRTVAGHPISSTVANVMALATANPGDSGVQLAAPVVGVDFRGETATLSFDQSSLVAHCAAHQPNTIDYTGTFTIG